MKRICVIVVAALACAVFGDEKGSAIKTVDMAVYPAKAAQASDTYRLLPKADEQSDSDALALYEKAKQLMPKDLDIVKISNWLESPVEKLPQEEVKSTVQQLEPVLQVLEQAGKCKRCQWPEVKTATSSSLGPEYRNFSYVLALKARLETSQGQYEKAVGTLQTGFVISRHLAESPALVQGMIGVAVVAVMLREVEQLQMVQAGPSLCLAIGDLPTPFIDLNKQMEAEIKNIESQYRNPLTRKKMKDILKPAHERIRVMTKKLDRQIAALRCIEALRLYAGSHEGKLPEKLDDITQVSVPNDPVTGKPFLYRVSGGEAVLEGPVPEGGRPQDAMQYKVTLKEGSKKGS